MAAAAAVVPAACSSTKPAPATAGAAPAAASPGTLTVRGDWDDVDAALEVALTKAQMAILKRTAVSPDRLEYDLLTIHDEPARLTATRDHGAGDQLIQIHLEARVGHFGDPASEERLLTAISRRLEQLAGVDYAPIR